MTPNDLSKLRLVQISDCHVSAAPGADYRGQNALRGLTGLLPAIGESEPDAILLTGDVSEDGSPASYARVAALLAPFGIPLLALPGNHDVPDVMMRYFPQGPWSGPLLRAAGDWLLVALDSTAPGAIDGAFAADYLDRLGRGLRRSPARHVLVALHHQPVPVASPWIDRYALREPGPFLDLLERDGRVRGVTWGHVHQDFRSERGGMVMLGSPSSAANGIPGGEKFALDPAGPACRWFELDSGGGVETGILRAC